MIVSFLLFLFGFGFSAILEGVINVGHAVTDMVHKDGTLYVATEQGEVRFINLKDRELIKSVHLPPIRDFMGNPIPPKVYSVDLSPSGRELLIVSEASGGFSEVYIYGEEKGFKKLIDLGWNMIIREGRFLDENRLLLALLGDEIAVMDKRSGKFIYRVQVGRSSLSDIDLSDDRKRVAVSDEGGVVTLVRLSDGKVLRKLKGINKDKLYRLDYRDGKVLVGGRDRRVALYDLESGTGKSFSAKFFVFAVAMDSSARVGAFTYNERNDIKLVDLDSGKTLDLLEGHRYPVSVILFVGNIVLTGCDDGKIFIWRLER